MPEYPKVKFKVYFCLACPIAVFFTLNPELMLEVRMATQKDIPKMLDIYGPIIQNTSISFEYDLPTLEQFAGRVNDILKTHPWLVCIHQDQLAGYAYAGPHRSREAYQWSTELSVYIAENYQKMGIAKALYQVLVKGLKLQGFHTGLAGITLPNEASIKFHESFGFSPIGTYHNVGFKFGRWHSVGWWEYQLTPYAESPGALLPNDVLNSSVDWQHFTKSISARLNASNKQ